MKITLLQMHSLVLNLDMAQLMPFFTTHYYIEVLSSKKKLYCYFVDYRKAFDSVNRYKLLFRLARSGIREREREKCFI